MTVIFLLLNLDEICVKIGAVGINWKNMVVSRLTWSGKSDHHALSHAFEMAMQQNPPLMSKTSSNFLCCLDYAIAFFSVLSLHSIVHNFFFVCRCTQCDCNLDCVNAWTNSGTRTKPNKRKWRISENWIKRRPETNTEPTHAIAIRFWSDRNIEVCKCTRG